MSLAEVFATPDEAEAAYYRAFSHADIDLMTEVWLASESVSCIHPLADEIHGYRFVLASWRAIFHNQGKVQIDHRSTEKHQAGDLAVHVGVEIVTARSEQHTILTTNVFQLDGDGWRMLSHHASPKPRVSGRGEGLLH